MIPSGVLEPSFSRGNLGDMDSLKESLLNLIPSGKKKGDIALSIPNHVARVTCLEFDRIPDKRDEVEKLLLWRMKKSLPFSPAEAKVDYQVLKRVNEGGQIIASVAKKSIVQEYENLFREIGLRPQVVDISTINAMFFFQKALTGNSVFADIRCNTVGISIISDGRLVFFRSKDFKGNLDAALKETVSTIDYFSTNHPDVSIQSLYILSDITALDDLVNGLKERFEGEVIQLKCSDYIKFKVNRNDSPEAFSPAMGAALRLQVLK